MPETDPKKDAEEVVESTSKSDSAAKKPLDAKARKEAERKRIERSKQIAAEARSKKGPTARRGKKSTRDDASLTREQLRASGRTEVAEDENPVWFKPIMFGFLILGFLWIIVYYLSQGRMPIASIADWNILVGFGIALVGFLMMSNWK
ncbi:cell division protein CrgA [Gulosibacter bifidus]|uniref:Cell division protein CrgA n=1 Tax=Gulosibacter bifidus TaxID=272239 RepID=A0ABW5RKV3_9MICO|nr:cell division protein CrgA [Gulosibacter bifidus]